MIILDTNIFISYSFHGDSTLEKYLKGTEPVIAPQFMAIEMWNVLRKIHSLQNVPLMKVESVYTFFENTIDHFFDDMLLLEKARELSFSLNHPIYDCLFLALSFENDALFISKDQRLVAKAVGLGLRAAHA